MKKFLAFFFAVALCNAASASHRTTCGNLRLPLAEVQFDHPEVANALIAVVNTDDGTQDVEVRLTQLYLDEEGRNMERVVSELEIELIENDVQTYSLRDLLGEVEHDLEMEPHWWVRLVLEVSALSGDDVLFGDFFLVSSENDYAQGYELDAVGCEGARLCEEFAVRFLNGGPFNGGTNLILYEDRSPITASGVYTRWYTEEGGPPFAEYQLDDLPRAARVKVVHPDLPPSVEGGEALHTKLLLEEPFGWARINFEDEREHSVRYSLSANGRFSVGVEGWCIQRDEPFVPPECVHVMIQISGPNANGCVLGQPCVYSGTVTGTGPITTTHMLAPGLTSSGTSTSWTVIGIPTAVQDSVTTSSNQCSTAPITVPVTEGPPPPDEPGRLKAIKTVQGGSAQPSDWTFVFLNAEHEEIVLEHLEEREVEPGSWCFQGEIGPSGYELASVDGDLDANGCVEVPEGGLRVATFLNVADIPQPEPPVCVGMTVSPANGPPGSPRTLQWDFSGDVTSVTVTPGVGTFSGPDGSAVVNPTVTTTYVAVAEGNRAGSTCQATATVTPPEPESVECTGLSVSPSSGHPGDSFTATWSATGDVAFYVFNPGNVEFPPTMTSNTFTLMETTVVSVRVVGTNGSTDTCSQSIPITEHPVIDIEKETQIECDPNNWYDADVPTGPVCDVGKWVRWRYRVQNTGDVFLTAIFVNDDRGVQVDCPQGTLNPGEYMYCWSRNDGTIVQGQYVNRGSVYGQSLAGTSVEDHDLSHHFGNVPTCEEVNPPDASLTWSDNDGILTGNAFLENASTWDVYMYATSSMSKCQQRQFDYEKVHKTKVLTCGSSASVNVSYDWEHHSSKAWLIEVRNNGASTPFVGSSGPVSTGCIDNPYN